MSKKSLILTLLQLQTLSAPLLAALYKDTTGKDADASLNKEVLLVQLLEVADPAPEPKQPDAAKQLPTFVNAKKTYQLLMPKVFIPGIGERTATEITVDAKAQKYLIDSGCVGTVIKEVSAS